MCLGTWGQGDEPGAGAELLPQGCCSPLPGEMERTGHPWALLWQKQEGDCATVLPPAVHFTPGRPFLNVLSLTPVRCALKMMPKVMPKMILTDKEGRLTSL